MLILQELQAIRRLLEQAKESDSYVIYKISMSNSTYVYIGMTSDLDKRMQQHLSQLKKKNSLQQSNWLDKESQKSTKDNNHCLCTT